MTLPHNERKHNNNQISLQNIGNLSYHRDKSTTSYDSVHSLTNPKDHSQSYIPITRCLLSHILSCSRLSSLEKMYYILADSLVCINSSKGRNRSVSLPAKSWEERLSCSKSEVFVLQKSLEDKGYFIIYRNKNDKGQNNRNTITTTIPDLVFNDLKYEPDRFNLNSDDDMGTKVTDHSNSDNLDSIDKTFIPNLEGKRQHLAKTKMFIRVPYQFLKQLNSNCSISATSKIILLYLFTKIYKSTANKYHYNDSDSSLTRHSYSIVTSYQELKVELKLHRNSLAKALKTLEDANLIKRDQIVIKSDDDYNSRADKSLWRISLLNVPLITNPNDQHVQEGQEERINLQEAVISDHTKVEYNNNQALESFVDKGCTKYDPPCTDSGQLYIKDFVLKNSIIKNIDYIDVKSEEEFLENEQSSFPYESYNNSFKSSIKPKPSCSNTTSESAARTIKDISVKERELVEYVEQIPNMSNASTIKNEAQELELRHFYPLSEKDIDTLNFRANREFSSNFVNQLLLKLYIKYPEKRFKNRFTFLSYMEKILKNEKHQGPLVNHTSFRFSCNIGAIEKNILEYERYLNQIENSFDTSKEMQVRKKIAGRYSSELAYKILTQVEFKTNPGNSLITALIPSSLDLSEQQIEILSEQLEAVYGINGYYVQDVEKETLPQQTTTSDIAPDDKSIGNLASSNRSSAILENTVWHQIRKGMREELGNDIDQAWFSKTVVKECAETKTLTLTMPTRFMADWVKNNYSHVIRRLAVGKGVENVEYEC